MLAVILVLTLIFEFGHEYLMEKLEHQHAHLLIETVRGATSSSPLYSFPFQVNVVFRELMVSYNRKKHEYHSFAGPRLYIPFAIHCNTVIGSCQD